MEINSEVLINIICVEFKIWPRDLVKPCNQKGAKKPKYSIPRQIGMKILSENTGMLDGDIGNIFNRDRSTVNHACKAIQDLIDTDYKFRNRYQSIIEMMKVKIQNKIAKSFDIQELLSEKNQLENKKNDLKEIASQPLVTRMISLNEINNLLHEISLRISEIDKILSDNLLILDKAS